MKSGIHFFCGWFAVFFLAIPSGAWAASEGDGKKLEDMSLEELLNLQVSVASKKPETARSSAGIVTVITDEEIANSGARDLMDILLIMVPGFTFGTDVEGVTSLGVRGNWAEEGKALLLWDGQEMNDGYYGNIPVGHRFPADQIKRIEIIRGPGSANYGGFAELAVINVITKSAADLDGVQARAIYSQMAGTYGREDLSVQGGKKWGDLGVSLSAFAGQMNRSNRDYTDANGSTYNLSGSTLDPVMLNLGVKYADLEVRVIAQLYRLTERDAYGQSLTAPVRTDFDGYYAGAKYVWHASDKISVTPYFNYKLQYPWQATGPLPQISEQNIFTNVSYNRTTEGLSDSWDILPELNLQSGVELYQEHTHATAPTTFTNSPAGQYDFSDEVAYAQALWVNSIANVTLGARLNYHSFYGTSFVPRLGLTKQISDWNFKFLLSRGYRAPTSANIDSNPGIKPEDTTVTEVQAGYQISDTLYATVNFFNISISNPIIFTYDAVSLNDVYKNYDTAGTRGFELELRYKEKWGYLNTNFSYYQPISAGIVSYSVPGDDTALLGMPNCKWSLYGNFSTPVRDLKLSPSLVWLSSQWAYTALDASNNPVLSQLGSMWLANLFFMYDDLFGIKSLDAGIGVMNIFNTDYLLAQPYTSAQDGQGTPHPPIAAPGGAREAVLELGYSVPL